MNKPGNPADRRQFGRRQTSLHAWINVQGRPKLSCVVLDLSIGGALLALEKPSWLPYNFQLTIEATRFVTWCEIRHHKPNAVGVRFLSAIETAELDQRYGKESRSMDDKDAWAGAQGESSHSIGHSIGRSLGTRPASRLR